MNQSYWEPQKHVQLKVYLSLMVLIRRLACSTCHRDAWKPIEQLKVGVSSLTLWRWRVRGLNPSVILLFGLLPSII